ncbi:MAG: hypothetical protein ABIJ31_07795 [Pseudomonadota bacterium]
MKQYKIQNQICDQCLTGAIVIFWIAGLLIAGSESIYMPWLNMLGLISFLVASIVLGKRLHPVKKTTGTLIQPDFFKNQLCMAKGIQKKNKRCHTRYALSA